MLQYDVTEEIIHQHNQKSPYQRVVMTTQRNSLVPSSVTMETRLLTTGV